MLYNPVIFTHSCMPLCLACLHMVQEVVHDLSEGQLGGLRVHQEQEAEGPLHADATFLSGGSRLTVCAQPKNPLWLS